MVNTLRSGCRRGDSHLRGPLHAYPFADVLGGDRPVVGGTGGGVDDENESALCREICRRTELHVRELRYFHRLGTQCRVHQVLSCGVRIAGGEVEGDGRATGCDKVPTRRTASMLRVIGAERRPVDPSVRDLSSITATRVPAMSVAATTSRKTRMPVDRWLTDGTEDSPGLPPVEGVGVGCSRSLTVFIPALRSVGLRTHAGIGMASVRRRSEPQRR